MGAGVAAAHLVIFLAVASAGTILVGASTDAWSQNTEANQAFLHRLQDAATEDIDLASGGYHPEHCTGSDPNPGEPGCQGGSGPLIPERTYANFTNDGGNEIPLDEVTVLLDGSWTDTSTLDTFEVRGATTSELWMPGEILEIMIEGQGDLDVTVAGPHGAKAHRRA